MQLLTKCVLGNVQSSEVKFKEKRDIKSVPVWNQTKKPAANKGFQACIG